MAEDAVSVKSLYVGDLDPNVTAEELFSVFSEIGHVASYKICGPFPPFNLVHAYVNYNTHEDAARAVEVLNFTKFHGRPARVMFQNPSSNRFPLKGNIYIKDLPKRITHKDLYEAFSPFGKILSCKVELDTAGVSKGFGYVQYKHEECVKDAIENMNGRKLLDIDNKGIFVGCFKSKEERDTPGPVGFNNIYVNNLPETVTQEDLLNKFKVYGNILSAVVVKNEDGKSRGFGFVCYQKSENALAAVEALNGKPYEDGEKPMYLGKAQKKAERKSEQEELKKKFQGVNLYLKNLEDTVDEAKLKELFQGFGTVISCKIMRDPTGYSKGSGFVAFATPEQAKRARISMHCKMVGRKPIHVALAQTREDRMRVFNFNQNGFPMLYPRNRKTFYGEPSFPPQGPFMLPFINNNQFNSQQSFQQRTERSPLPSATSLLAAGSTNEQRLWLGERLFPQVQELELEHAGKVTGMLLEMDHNEILHLIETPDALKLKVAEAMEVLSTFKPQV